MNNTATIDNEIVPDAFKRRQVDIAQIVFTMTECTLKWETNTPLSSCILSALRIISAGLQPSRSIFYPQLTPTPPDTQGALIGHTRHNLLRRISLIHQHFTDIQFSNST